MTLPLSLWALEALPFLYLLLFSHISSFEQRHISSTQLCGDKSSVSQACVGLGGTGVAGCRLFPCYMQFIFFSEEVYILKYELNYARHSTSRGENRIEAPAWMQCFRFWEERRNYSCTSGSPDQWVMLGLTGVGRGQEWGNTTCSSNALALGSPPDDRMAG